MTYFVWFAEYLKLLEASLLLGNLRGIFVLNSGTNMYIRINGKIHTTFCPEI
jgi:hypothetical protein